MTPLETRRIENLRRAGWGYKNIAAFCGMSREAVRAYCLRENLEADPELVEQVCAWCGLALSGRSNSARFCCASCRWSAWNDKHQRTSDHARPCQACGKDFISAKKRQKYCSHSCYVRARFATKGWPGCPALTDTSYYEIHAKQADQNYRRYERDSEINKRYGAAWRKIRAAYVAPPLRDV